MMSLLRGVIASKSDIGKLKDIFHKLDTDHDGFILPNDLQNAEN